MKPAGRVVLGVAGFTVFVGFVVWRFEVAAHIKVPTNAIIADLTSSHQASRAEACLSIPGITETLIQTGSQPAAGLVVLALGDSRTGGEPIRLSTDETVPVRHAISTGEDVLRKQRDAYLAALYTNCLHAPSPEYSAVYLGVERALEVLRSHGCTEGVGCVLYVDTDAEENANVALKARLAGGPQTRSGQVVPLDNSGIDVRFCGLAETAIDAAKRSTGSSRRAIFQGHGDDRHVEDVWRSVFTAPDSVSFAPYCPQPGRPDDYIRGSAESENR